MTDLHMENVVNTFYMPEKLKNIAQFIDKNVPIQNMENKALKRVKQKMHQSEPNAEATKPIVIIHHSIKI